MYKAFLVSLVNLVLKICQILFKITHHFSGRYHIGYV